MVTAKKRNSNNPEFGRKSPTVTIRVRSNATKNRWKKFAKINGESLSEFVRQAVEAKIRRVMKEGTDEPFEV